AKTDTAESREEVDIRGQAWVVNSAHKESQLRFDGAKYPVGHTVWDEWNSTIRDTTTSTLVNRATVLPELSTWMDRTGKANKVIVLMDANLTDADVDAAAAMYGIPREKVLKIENDYKFWQGKVVTRKSKPAAMHELEQHCKDGGGPVWITNTAQKPGSSYGTNGVKALMDKYGRQVLVLDSSTVCDPQHPASRIMALLQEDPRQAEREIVEKGWDICHSPSIESGLSIEIFGHFEKQFSFVSGNLLPEAVTQQVFRLRDCKVPVTLGVDNAMYQSLQRGNGSITPEGVEAGEHARHKSNIHQLIAPGVRTEFLSYWYQDSARINAMLPNYADHICKLLEDVGCTIIIDQGDPKDFAEEVKERAANSKQRAADHARKVAEAESISDKQAREISEAKYKGQDSQKQLEKHSIEGRYKCH
ncbi:MAG: hypothetical protein ACRC16_19375, partial [Aeromonas salmonicida]